VDEGAIEADGRAVAAVAVAVAGVVVATGASLSVVVREGSLAELEALWVGSSPTPGTREADGARFARGDDAGASSV
jgi:hypothetical protein